MSHALGVSKDKLSRMQPVPWLLCMTLVLGIVMGGVYLAGRKSKPDHTARTRPLMEPLVIPTVEAASKGSATASPAARPPASQAVVPAAAMKAPAPVPATPMPATTAPATTVPASAAPARAVPPAPVAAAPAGLAPGVLSDQDARGLLFLQVGAVDASLGRDFAQKIAGKGFKVRLAAGPDAKVLRVLVGPLAPAEVTPVKDRLQAAGHTSFPRQY